MAFLFYINIIYLSIYINLKFNGKLNNYKIKEGCN